MTSKHTPDLRYSIADGLSYSLMVGVGEAYIPAFALAVGLNQVVAGLLATIPLLGGGILQLFAPYGISRLGSFRKWVCICAFVQALCFLPLIFGAAFDNMPAILLFMVTSIYWGCGLAAGAAWNCWMEEIIPKKVRTNFLAYRNRIMQFFTLLGFVLSGHLLWHSKKSNFELYAFVILFSVAFFSRTVSTFFLFKQREADATNKSFKFLSFNQVRHKFKTSDSTKFLFFLIGMQLTVHISAPYFNPYMLKQIHLSYLDYISIISAAYIGRIISLPTLGMISNRIGAFKMLWICGLLIAPLSGAWVLSSNLLYLISIQVFSGVVWGGFELAAMVLVFENIPSDERNSILSWYNLAHTLSIVSGSLIGGIILELYSEAFIGFQIIFVFSSIMRLMPMLILFKIKPSFIYLKNIQLRTLGLRAAVGAVVQPIFGDNNHTKTKQPHERK